MDFNDSPDEAAYREKVRAWLSSNAKKRATGDGDAMESEGDNTSMAASKAWQAKKAAAGYAQITWPKEWGGQGGTPIQQVIFNQEEGAFDVPPNPFQIGLGMCVPTVMTFADDATKQRYVGPALRGEEIWCQLFSEPAGGSDVAAVRTKAVRDGDAPDADWIINGQKVWTTGAQFSDFGIVLVRTSPDKPKHKGMTMFWLDMKAPGVGGEADPPDVGRSLVQRGLFHRRAAEGQPTPRRGGRRLEGGAGHADERTPRGRRVHWHPVRPHHGSCARHRHRERSYAEGRRFPREAGRLVCADRGLKFTRFRTMTALSKGQTPGPESSIGK